MATIPCAIIRGGTSKGVFIREDCLPTDPARRDAALIALMGSPDPRQIDGLGGADPLTSKVVIVSRTTRQDCHVEYESVEVALGESFVNHGIMCGNLTAGVTAFAMIEGLVSAQAPSAGVRMFCRNTGKTIVCRSPQQAGSPSFVNGPAGTAATVSLVFEEPAGAVTGKLLPTGEPVSTVKLEDGRVLEVSVVDAGTLYAFMRAEDVGVSGAEAATELDIKVEFRKTIEASRVRITQLINERLEAAGTLSPRRVKMAIVARASESADSDLLARVINPAKVHKAYAVSGAISLGSAASIHGTVVNEIVRTSSAPATVRIGHPTGVLPVVVHYSNGPAGHCIHGAEIQRSFRVLMRGEAYLAADAA